MVLEKKMRFIFIVFLLLIPVRMAFSQGEPREQYERTYWVINDTGNLQQWQVREIAGRAFDDNQRTLGYSFDDAGIGDLNVRNIVVWGWPENDINTLLNWYKQYYGGVRVTFRSLPGETSYYHGPYYTQEPASGRGQPRWDYPREYWVLDGRTASRNKFINIAVEAFYDSRQTVGFSFDDAGIGNLTNRKVVVKEIGHYTEQGLRDFYNTYYPGVFLSFDYPNNPMAGSSFINPLTGDYHKFVGGNYTDLGVNSNGSMPSDEATLKNNANEDLNRLKGIGVTNVRIWACRGYNQTDYEQMANRVTWISELAESKDMTITVDLFDSSNNNTLENLLNNEEIINNMINIVIGNNRNKDHIYWSLGNEIGGCHDPNAFADYYEEKVREMRNAGANHISFQPVPGSLEHRWDGDTRDAAIRVINASDDISVHFYALGCVTDENNRSEFTSMQHWVQLANQNCKPATIGEFGISNIDLRTDENVRDWLRYFNEVLYVDQVLFWQFCKNDAGHLDSECFCDPLPNFPGNGNHIGGMTGYLNANPAYPSSSQCR